jgi:hypothetical protein
LFSLSLPIFQFLIANKRVDIDLTALKKSDAIVKQNYYFFYTPGSVLDETEVSMRGMGAVLEINPKDPG